MRVVVVGAGAAGTTAAAWVRRVNRNAELMVVTEERWGNYSRCALPHLIAGVFETPEQIVENPPSFFKQTLRAEIRQARVERLDVDRRTLILEGGEALTYDSLVLATGAKPRRLGVPGEGLQGVYVLRTIEDALEIRERAKRAETAVVVGAGFIGMEVAEALHQRGLRVVVVHRSPEILSAVLDPDLAKRVRGRSPEGVEYRLSAEVARFEGGEEVEAVVLKTGERVETQLVVIAIGVVPHTELAAEAKIATDRCGILVDEYMRTSAQHVYACGDVTSYYNAVTKTRGNPRLGTVAVRQGIVAGTNAAGGKAVCPPFTGAATSRLFGVEVATVGCTSRSLTRRGIAFEQAKARGWSHEPIYPGAHYLEVKLLFDPCDGRVLGAQVVGEEKYTVAPRANLLSLVIARRMTVFDLKDLESCYAPPVAPVWDPVWVAARLACAKVERRKG